MPAPIEVTRWVDAHYPRPKVAPEWLGECYNWIVATHGLSDSARDLPAVLEHVEMQLLNSDLRDSTLPGTGLPRGVAAWQKACLPGAAGGAGGVLVEVAALTEIGNSAFSLLQVRERRIESEGVLGLDDDDDDVEDDANAGDENYTRALPKYPHSMLRFELTDGTVTIPAIEYRPLPELELGVTPLGFKMVLKGTLIRGGTAFLEPHTTILKGGRNEERDRFRDEDFVRGLKLRLGQDPGPPPREEGPDENARQNNAVVSPPRLAAAAATTTTTNTARVPPPALPAPPPSPPGAAHAHDDDELPRRRKVPQTPVRPPRVEMGSNTQARSPYFPTPPNAASSSSKLETLARERLLAPARSAALVMPEEGARSSGEGAPPHGDASSEYEYGDDILMDAAFLEDIEDIERAERAAQSPTQPPAQLHNAASASFILIDSDSEQEDKENVPLSLRRVRRRTDDGMSIVASEGSMEDVIEIPSDIE